MKLHIRLGPQRFAAEREGLSIMGTVQRGLQIGALARGPDGEYLQVNGDVTQPLNKSRVELALKKSGGLPRTAATSAPAVMPTVIVKPRRRIAVIPPEGDAAPASTPTPAPAPAPADASPVGASPAAPPETRRITLGRRKLTVGGSR